MAGVAGEAEHRETARTLEERGVALAEQQALVRKLQVAYNSGFYKGESPGVTPSTPTVNPLVEERSDG